MCIRDRFKEISSEIFEFIKNSDLAGFNSDRFDIPLLMEELLRSEIDFKTKELKTIDVQTIFHKMEQRNLSAALEFYCNKKIEKAHSAAIDTQATFDVLMAQLDRYDNLEPNVSFLNDFTKRKKSVDFAGYIVFNKKGKECFSFGKHKGKALKDVPTGYIRWLDENGALNKPDNTELKLGFEKLGLLPK